MSKRHRRRSATRPSSAIVDEDRELVLPIRTQTEVAQIMTDRGYPMGRGRVHQIEKEALEKIRRHPLIQELVGGE